MRIKIGTTLEVIVFYFIVFICSVGCFKPFIFPSRLRSNCQLSSATYNRPTPIFIGNIPLNVSVETLTSILSEIVPLLSINLQFDRLTHVHKGFGNVWFNSSQDASNALRILDGLQINSVSLRFESFQPVPERRTSKLTSDNRSIYVGNMPYSVTEPDILRLCQSIGLNVMGIRMPSGSFRGFTHLDFANASESAAALSKLSDCFLQGRRLKVGPSRTSSSARPQSTQNTFQVFVGNLSTRVTEEYFEGFLHQIVGRKLYNSLTMGRNKSTGKIDVYIDCWHEAGRENIIRKLTGKELFGQVLRVEKGLSSH